MIPVRSQVIFGNSSCFSQEDRSHPTFGGADIGTSNQTPNVPLIPSHLSFVDNNHLGTEQLLRHAPLLSCAVTGKSIISLVSQVMRSDISGVGFFHKKTMDVKICGILCLLRTISECGQAAHEKLSKNAS